MQAELADSGLLCNATNTVTLDPLDKSKYVTIYRRCRLILCEVATLAVLTTKWNGLHPIRISNRRSSYAKITK